MSTVRLDRVSLVLRQAGWTAAALRHLPDAVRHQGQQLSAMRSPHPHPDPRPPAHSVGLARSHAPVVLVHGYGATTDCWSLLGRRLAAESFDQVFLFGYNGLSTGLPELAHALAGAVRSVLSETGSGTVHLVGHSLGGLVVRLATEAGGLWPHVATVVTVATPHRGSVLAWVAPGRTARWMRPGLSALPDPVLAGGPDEPRYLNFYCARDAVLTRRSARFEVERVENVEITGAGHIGATRAGSLLSRLPSDLAAAERSRRPLRLVGRPAGPQWGAMPDRPVPTLESA